MRPHVYYLAPTGVGAGLTSVSLGVVRALDRVGLRLGFCKPIAQNTDGIERSTRFIRETTQLHPPEPMPISQAENLVLRGKQAQLLEEVLERVDKVAAGVQVIVVEGLVSTPEQPFTATINTEIVRSLDAEVILVTAAEEPAALSERLEHAARPYGGTADAKVLGAVVNKLGAPARVAWSQDELAPQAAGAPSAEELTRQCPVFQQENFRLLGAIPWQQQLVSPRVSDVANSLGAAVLNRGEMERRRINEVSLCARSIANMTHRLKPETLLITPGDRDDIILAACMAALNGVPIAGLLLTGGIEPNPRIMKLCEKALATGLPVLLVDTNSYVTVARTAALELEVPVDDIDRIENVMDAVADHLDVVWLKDRLAIELEPRMSPAAFMYQLVARARKAGKRIVLPEGDEPRTIQAAIACQERGIARCVLLGRPEEVRRQAEMQGLGFPEQLDVVDPDEIRRQYIRPLVALRRHKGMTVPLAAQHLEDNVVLGTMMLAQDKVDGLVSGAVHTTANTIRPALQLIKTRPNVKLVSSVFFMCLPEQVLVYGDCAINTDPNAEELADIAIQSAESALAFGIEPRVAMISYSTGTSGEGKDVEKVREATGIARSLRPDLLIDGPLQYDAASVPEVASVKAPESRVAGRATVLVFPDLNTGNTTYKAVQRSAGVVSIGPMLQGLRKPVNDVSRGALIDDIIYTIALTAIQAEQVDRVPVAA